tara:strand:- start:268 stop:786 length:519 start_codon:yes stop_codon:yes gene_type:complete
MKEDTLRGMIRKQIKSSLKESPIARSAVGAKLGSVEKMAGVKMLKKALGQGTPAQQAAGLLQVVQAISGNNPATSKMLARMIMKKGITADAPEPTVEESSPNFAIKEAEVSSALSSKMGRVDKTQAMQMMKKTLGTKPATQQVDFVVSMINGLDLKDSAKKRLLLKLRKGLE